MPLPLKTLMAKYGRTHINIDRSHRNFLRSRSHAESYLVKCGRKQYGGYLHFCICCSKWTLWPWLCAPIAIKFICVRHSDLTMGSLSRVFLTLEIFEAQAKSITASFGLSGSTFCLYDGGATVALPSKLMKV